MIQILIVVAGVLTYRLYDAKVKNKPIDTQDTIARLVAICFITYILYLIGV
jgi:hypothetical protein